MKKIIFLLAILAVILFGCGKASEPQQVQQEVISEQTVQEDVVEQTPIVKGETEVVAEEPQLREFTVHGSSFEFDNKELKVKKGDRVRITFISDDIGHNLLIDEFNIRTNVISSGATEVVEFIADKIGTFPFYCSVGQHRSLGMESKLIVEP